MPLWLHWIILGFLAGGLAKFLVPGRDPAGCIVTVALGLAGAFIGGWIGTILGWGRITSSGFSLRSLALATLGAMMLLVLGRLVFSRMRHGGNGGPSARLREAGSGKRERPRG